MRKMFYSERLVNISEAAKILGVSPRTLRRWDEKGILKSFSRIGNRKDRRYKVSEVKKLLNKNHS